MAVGSRTTVAVGGAGVAVGLGWLSATGGGTLTRLPGTIATNVMAFERGARVFRVHDVAPVRDALAVAAATLGGRWSQSPETTTPTS